MRRFHASPLSFPGSNLRLLLPALVVLPLFLAGAQAAETSSGRSFLVSSDWSAVAYSHHAAGTVCWIEGPDGSLRMEVRRGTGTTSPDGKLEPLLNWIGEGWTLVLGPRGNGTLNAWGREWRPVPAGLSQLVRLVVSALRTYPGPAPDFPFAVSVGDPGRYRVMPRPGRPRSDPGPGGSPDTWRYQLAPLSLAPDPGIPDRGFRGRMVSRGRGGGARGEILTLRWLRAAAGDRYGLRVVSSRRPGTLELGSPGYLAVAQPDPEVFLPLWPLSRFLETR